jgi:hypothetical protein
MKYHTLCGFHKPYRPFAFSPDPREDCPGCQAAKDSKHSEEIFKGHVPGVWCKEHNQCSDCTEIKHHVKVLKHYGGTCSPKKCPVCEWARNNSQIHNVKIHESPVVRLKTILRIYKLMLGTKIYKYYKYWRH